MFQRLLVAMAIFSIAFAYRTPAQSTSGNKTAAEPKQPTSSPSPKQETIESRVEKYLRNTYAWGPQFEVKVGPTKQSPVPDLLEIPLTISMDGQSDNAIVYVTKNGNYIFRGDLTDMSIDPLADIRSKLNPGNSPSIGPADAKITLIEFADFECPSCRELDRILRDFMTSHPEVRLVYKNFPLTELHPWAMTAAIASQCTYQQDPAKFWKIHDAIFDAQDVISPSNVRDKMIDLAAQQGLNIETFRACMANPEATHQVEQTMEEGRAVNITGTPTTFVNGRRLIGPDKSLLEQFTRFERPRS
jgi:protein-disulfide isomerase